MSSPILVIFWIMMFGVNVVKSLINIKMTNLCIKGLMRLSLRLWLNIQITGLHSLQSIWLFARAQGFISKEKNHFKNSKDFNKRTFVSRNTIHNILKNPFYYGEMWLKKQNKLVPHIYEPIITKALFDKVQTILKSKGTEVYTHEQQYKAIAPRMAFPRLPSVKIIFFCLNKKYK